MQTYARGHWRKRCDRTISWHRPSQLFRPVHPILAAFDLATISFSLFLNHQMLTIYTDSVALNQRWAERSRRYAALYHLAASVNAPGNDVFATRDVQRESARLVVALQSFNNSMQAARDDLSTHVDERFAVPLSSGLDEVNRATQEMAGRRMAEMDRKYDDVRTALDALPAFPIRPSRRPRLGKSLGV